MHYRSTFNPIIIPIPTFKMNKIYYTLALFSLLSSLSWSQIHNTEDPLILAEYALIDGDTSSSLAILRHMQANSKSPTIKARAQLRLFSLLASDSLEINDRSLHPNQKLVQAICLYRAIIGEKIPMELWDHKILQQVIQEVEELELFPTLPLPAHSSSFAASSVSAWSHFLEQHQLKLQSFNTDALRLKLNEYIRNHFLRPASSERRLNPYFIEFHKYYTLLTWYDLQLGQYLNQLTGSPPPSALPAVLTAIDQYLTWRQELRQTGLIDADRKRLLNRSLDLPELAINMFHRLYQDTHRKIWLERIFSIMHSLKGETYYHHQLPLVSGGLVSSFGKQILAEIERSKTTLEDSRAKWNRGERIKQLALLAQQQEALYYYCQTLEKEAFPTSILQPQDVQAVNQRLGSVYIEFMDTDDSFYAILLDKEKIQFNIIEKSKKLQAAIAHLTRSFEVPELALFSSKQEVVEFRKQAWFLYDELLADIFPDLPPASLIIIPDGELHTLPFDALCIKDSKDVKDNNSYLVNYSSISYYPSASFFVQHHESSSLLGFDRLAIYTARYSNLSYQTKYLHPKALPGSKVEAEAIQKYFAVKSVVANHTDLNQFVERDFHPNELVHLAMHGKVSKRQEGLPQLLFTERDQTAPLNTSKIAQLHSAPQAIILNACETANGRYTPGEGLASLSQAFLQLGTRSIIASLYRIEDKIAQQIMDQFYAELQAGHASNIALQNAKRNYLRQADLVCAHPVFWAGLVMQGQAFVYVQ